MACESGKAKLDAYADGELSGQEMRDFDQHVRSCASCSADALARVQMKRAVHAAAARRFTPSAEFRRKIEQSVAAKPRRRFAWTWQPVLAACAVLIVAAVLGSAYWQMRSARKHLFNEVADLHVATLASASPVDVLSTDRHTVKPWFQGRIPFSFTLPELKDSGYTLVGGRVAYLDQTAGAQLIYDVRKHHISVFIFPEDKLRSIGTVSGRLSAPFNLQTWTQGGLRYFVISDAGTAEVDGLVRLLKGQ